MPEFMDFSFDQGDESVGKKSQRFKAKEDETYRVSFVWLPKDDDGNIQIDGPIRFTGCERHYVQGVGYFLHKGPEYAKLGGGPPKQSVATVIVVWPTDKRGKLNKDAFSKGEGFEVMSWVFSSERYDVLRRRNDNFPLTENDLILACTDTQYQKMDIQPVPGNLLRSLFESDNPKAQTFAKTILDEVATIEAGLRNDMARDMSLEQLREKLGGAVGTPVGDGTAENVDNLLENLID